MEHTPKALFERAESDPNLHFILYLWKEGQLDWETALRSAIKSAEKRLSDLLEGMDLTDTVRSSMKAKGLIGDKVPILDYSLMPSLDELEPLARQRALIEAYLYVAEVYDSFVELVINKGS